MTGKLIRRTPLARPPAETAAAECISDDALIHLKSYKYSSVDKSPVSKYIMQPFVRDSDRPPTYLCLPSVPRAPTANIVRPEVKMKEKNKTIEGAVANSSRVARLVECVGRTAAHVARAQYGDPDRVRLRSFQRGAAGRLYARS